MLARLASGIDAAQFRAQAKALLAADVRPHEVQWSADGAQPGLVDAHESAAPVAPGAAFTVPAFFPALCDTVLLHRDPQRHALLYRLLWRLVHEPALRADPLDADLLLARRMERQVGHAMHKMRAFVRFRPVEDAGQTWYVAWFEPQHQVTQANAPWFARRFANMRWAILTPDCCVQWDLRQLHLSPGARREDAPAADAGEALWLTYYRSIFNPARLKLDMMRKEMPRRYWANLPEAALIGPLAGQAHARAAAMVDAPAVMPLRRLARANAESHAPAGTFAALHEATQACQACPLGAAATQAVHGEGPQGAALMLVGEQPGDQEDLRGRPFVGPAGQLLDRALGHAQLRREQLYLTNAVRHFKHALRGTRRIHKTPGQREAVACAQWLEQEIALVRPGALVALGGTAARSLLGREVAVTQEKGRWLQRPDGLAVLVTWHPSALLRMPPGERAAAMRGFVQDLRIAAAGPPGVSGAGRDGASDGGRAQPGGGT